MSLFDRFSRPGSRPPLRSDLSHRTVADLSDEELEAELLRRRRERARTRSEAGPLAATHDRDNPERQRLLQYYANLELPPFAPLDDVKRAYRELMRRYHPDRHAGDPERQKAAHELAQSLTRAYDALVAYLEQR